MMRTWKTISAMTTLALLCATAAHAQSRYNGFSVVLLLGETQGTAAGDGLPSAAGIRKALADVKDFLPYKSYKVLDTQWLRGGETRMKGTGTQEYDVGVTDANQIIPMAFLKEGMLRVAVNLREASAFGSANDEFRSAQLADLETRLAGLQAELNQEQAKFGAKYPKILELQRMIADLKQNHKALLQPPRKLIDTQFDMAIGETVVVGTSKIGGGDKGLVVLLTAVAAGGK